MQIRIQSFDVAKLIAVLAVILSHTLISTGFDNGEFQWLSDVCFSFDMPLFFIVSGYFLKPTSLNGDYVLKQARALLLPYVATVMVVILGSIVWNLIFSPTYVKSSMWAWTVAGMYGAGVSLPTMIHQVNAIGAIWFLPALFIAKLILAATEDTRCQPLIMVACFIVGAVTVEKVFLPWSIQPALCAVLFLWLGRQVKRYQVLDFLGNPVIMLLCLFVSYYNARYFGHLYMVQSVYADGLVRDVLFSVVTSITILKICMVFEQWLPRAAKLLGKIGSITLPIFCMHLVELNTINYLYLFEAYRFSPRHIWVYLFAIRLVIITALCLAIFVLPGPLKKIYYPHGRNTLVNQTAKMQKKGE